MKKKILILILILILVMAVSVVAICPNGQCHKYSDNEIDFDADVDFDENIFVNGVNSFSLFSGDVAFFGLTAFYDATYIYSTLTVSDTLEVQNEATFKKLIKADVINGKRADFGSISVYPTYLKADTGNFVIRLS